MVADEGLTFSKLAESVSQLFIEFINSCFIIISISSLLFRLFVWSLTSSFVSNQSLKQTNFVLNIDFIAFKDDEELDDKIDSILFKFFDLII